MRGTEAERITARQSAKYAVFSSAGWCFANSRSLLLAHSSTTALSLRIHLTTGQWLLSKTALRPVRGSQSPRRSADGISTFHAEPASSPLLARFALPESRSPPSPRAWRKHPAKRCFPRGGRVLRRGVSINSLRFSCRWPHWWRCLHEVAGGGAAVSKLLDGGLLRSCAWIGGVCMGVLVYSKKGNASRHAVGWTTVSQDRQIVMRFTNTA